MRKRQGITAELSITFWLLQYPLDCREWSITVVEMPDGNSLRTPTDWTISTVISHHHVSHLHSSVKQHSVPFRFVLKYLLEHLRVGIILLQERRNVVYSTETRIWLLNSLTSSATRFRLSESKTNVKSMAAGRYNYAQKSHTELCRTKER